MNDGRENFEAVMYSRWPDWPARGMVIIPCHEPDCEADRAAQRCSGWRWVFADHLDDEIEDGVLSEDEANAARAHSGAAVWLSLVAARTTREAETGE